ncbi:hypothetical protein LG314_04050 [Agrococcus terreus]|uniref:hypothetical protein n=1 Tax=Agrococcus terreus TaxID=574649 RepID=UPI00384E08D5
MSERRAAPAGIPRAAALAMAVLLGIYVVLAGDRAIRFIATGEPIGVGVGIALLVMFLAGAWALVREVVFGVQLDRAVRELDAAGGMPEPLPTTPGGRPDQEAALAAFPAARADVEAHEDSWASWLRLSMAYDAARDRRRARHAARQALRLRRAARRGDAGGGVGGVGQDGSQEAA